MLQEINKYRNKLLYTTPQNAILDLKVRIMLGENLAVLFYTNMFSKWRRAKNDTAEGSNEKLIR